MQVLAKKSVRQARLVGAPVLGTLTAAAECLGFMYVNTLFWQAAYEAYIRSNRIATILLYVSRGLK